MQNKYTPKRQNTQDLSLAELLYLKLKQDTDKQIKNYKNQIKVLINIQDDFVNLLNEQREEINLLRSANIQNRKLESEIL